LPGAGVGSNGDFYLNTANGDIYGPKTAGAWGAVIFNIAEGQTGPAGPTGDDGREIELQASATHLQWRYAGAASWTNLLALSEITGPAGDDGADGAAGADGADGDSAYEIAVANGFSGTEAQWLASLVGATGADGDPATATPLSDATPQAPGTAAAGTASSAARGDHVHALPGVVTSGAAGLMRPVDLGDVIVLACSDETTDLATGTARVTFRMPWAATLTAVRLSVNTAPTGSALIVDVNEGGTTVFSTRPQIDISARTSVGSTVTPVISDSALAADAEITVDIDQVGSTIKGRGLKVALYVTRA
jgi:hypothetical protein